MQDHESIPSAGFATILALIGPPPPFRSLRTRRILDWQSLIQALTFACDFSGGVVSAFLARLSKIGSCFRSGGLTWPRQGSMFERGQEIVADPRRAWIKEV